MAKFGANLSWWVSCLSLSYMELPKDDHKCPEKMMWNEFP